ncbi:sulfurtransferase complex subunit TusB [Ferrimonas lipolytica]|uniref:Sulfurtransferase complex subunit TusB n=1 Tax=Ferrimonas lipolytica TaxID=2724191 RepID=A0A6H1UBP7_9GAMM|nr:sulfurtransferase complex subunit TusB [Ferrimonas lipolytica]QIZ76481.1 sulfurtransferase complex subunit TusB [Ferrimonas lipolytica]
MSSLASLPTLHTLSQICANPDALMQQLRYRNNGDPVLLLQDAVLMAQQPRFSDSLNQLQLYILNDDLVARGVTIAPNVNATIIDYSQFVQLTLNTQQQVAW